MIYTSLNTNPGRIARVRPGGKAKCIKYASYAMWRKEQIVKQNEALYSELLTKEELELTVKRDRKITIGEGIGEGGDNGTDEELQGLDNLSNPSNPSSSGGGVKFVQSSSSSSGPAAPSTSEITYHTQPLSNGLALNKLSELDEDTLVKLLTDVFSFTRSSLYVYLSSFQYIPACVMLYMCVCSGF